MIRQIPSLLLAIVLVVLFSPITFAAQIPVTGSVVDSTVLAKGGLMAFAEFKPGPGAVADEQTDKISLMLIKGIRESLLTHASSLSLIDADQLDRADFLLEGHIEEFSRSGKLSRLVMRKNEAYLAVDGEIWRQDSGAKVLVFATSAIINVKKQKPAEVAYQMGLAIGDFISTHSLKE